MIGSGAAIAIGTIGLVAFTRWRAAKQREALAKQTVKSAPAPRGRA
jgi:hypothetical protein